jgi:uncharacterized membrane protein
MLLLAVGVGLFVAAHLVPAIPPLKAGISDAVGQRFYGPLFGGVATAALLLIVFGWRLSDFVPVYEPPAWGRHVNFALTAVAFICLGIFIFRGSWRQVLRFPLAIGVVFWAAGHLLANGDLASLILFGGMLGYGLAFLALGFATGARPTPEVRSGHDLLSCLSGIALYVAMTQLHPLVTGVPVLALW